MSGRGQSGDAGSKADGESNDPRFLFLASFVQKSLRLKSDRWAKMIAAEEPRKTIQQFLDNAHPPLIIFTQNGPSVLCVTVAPLNTNNHPAFPTASAAPSASRLKSVYCVKKRPEPVDRNNPRASLLFGDISPQPLEQVLTFLDDVSFTLNLFH